MISITGQNGKGGVSVGDYGNSEDVGGIVGWVEPAGKNPKWILWFDEKGNAELYTNREKTGAVKGKALKIKNT
jgi:hypothetical protein